MSLLLIGLLLFFGVHSISILVPGWRDAMVARIGERPWRGVYSLLSLGGDVARNIAPGINRWMIPPRPGGTGGSNPR
jgi:hypothetical protein